MKSVNIIPKAPQVHLKRDNTTAIRHTLCYAAVVLGIVALLIGCPDSTGDGNSDANGDTSGTPTEQTKVQSTPVSAVSTNAITLNWTAPTDTDGFLGVAISEENNAGSLSEPVELDDDVTEYQVTGLSAGTEYTFTIATRYTASGKNNTTTIEAMTALATEVQNVALDAAETTSDSATITWENPEDTTDYTGVSISAAATVGDLDMGTPRMVDADTNTLTISGLAAETEHTFTLTFATEYSDTTKNSSSAHPITVTTQSNRVTNVAASDITENSITLTWTAPEDMGSDYEGVTIAAMPTITEVMVNQPTITMAIGSLDAFTNYEFTITTRYSTANKSGGMLTTVMIRTLTDNAIDRDGDTLVDITSLERLDNVRYNLDFGAPADTVAGTPADDGRYKESTQIADGEGVLCGADSNTKCTGYELMRSLDFADASSYEGGSIDTEWRPNNDDPAMATNAGWDPIGGEFATRFEGNGYTISNLYARNTDNSNGARIGLFDTIAAEGIVRSIGIADAALYGSNANDVVGGLVGTSNGSIIASYVHSSIVDGGTGNDNVGGLTGTLVRSSTVIASYTRDGTVSGGANTLDNVGGLIGSASHFVIASYTRDGTVSGGAGVSDFVGGLIGNLSNSSSINIAVYATSAVTGGSDNNDVVGGLIGNHPGAIRASYATGVADGGAPDDTGNRAYALYGFRTSGTGGTAITDSYGFGTPVNSDSGGGSNGSTWPTGVTAAADLTADNVPATWNSAAHDTLDAWDFGTAAQIPALRYADYDGPDNDDYHCGDNDIFTGIPTVAASPGGPIPVVCGETLLPGQRP